MNEFWNNIQLIFSAIIYRLEYFLGGFDNLLNALIVFELIDYLIGVMCAIINRKSFSEVGFKEIFRKFLIFLLIGITDIIDVQIIGISVDLRTATILFYISNAGTNILANLRYLGLPIPEKIEVVLEQLHDRTENGKESNK